MKVLDTRFEGLKVIEPDVFGDHRGWFMEAYNEVKFKEAGINIIFKQDNQSLSVEKGTLRGLHYQLEPKAQTKLVRCTNGVIFDVAVDLRKSSTTFGEWFGIELSAQNKKQLLIPKGFAHGFLTLSENVEVFYKVDEVYSPEFERSIIWNDAKIGIEWPLKASPILSAKDLKAPSFKEAEVKNEVE